uniref:Non-structural protein NP-1 n=1 Tax=Feline bocavirus TaxID=1174530 RepID=A0A649UEB1_9VIRU|nr:NP1 [Feline bocavirus]
MSSGTSSKNEQKRRRPRSLDRDPSPIPDKRARWSSTSHQNNGERCSDSSPGTSKRESRRSHSTVSNQSPKLTYFVKRTQKPNKQTPLDVFMKHRAKEGGDVPPFCGFYWHSTRLARFGTDAIFNLYKPKFQEMSKNNVITWDQCRDLLFDFKKNLDYKYRSIMWHFSMGEQCHKCNYWDKMYAGHLANVSLSTQEEDSDTVTDAEMLAVAMEVDGTDQ